MARAGLAYVATADLSSLPGEAQADCLRELERLESVHTAARASTVTAFLASRAFEADGQRSAGSWLRWQTQVTRNAAAAVLAWARRLAAHPAVARALAAAGISASCARAICAWSDLLPAAARAGADAILLAAAAGGVGLADLSVLAEEMYRRLAPADPDEDGFPDRCLRLDRTFRGAGRITGDLTPQAAAALQAVLESLGAKAGPEDERTQPQRDHDALEEACRRLIGSACLPDRAGQPTQIQLHMTLDQLRALPGAARAEAGWASTAPARSGWASTAPASAGWTGAGQAGADRPAGSIHDPRAGTAAASVSRLPAGARHGQPGSRAQHTTEGRPLAGSPRREQDEWRAPGSGSSRRSEPPGRSLTQGLPSGKDQWPRPSGPAAPPGADCDALFVPVVTGYLDHLRLAEIAQVILGPSQVSCRDGTGSPGGPPLTPGSALARPSGSNPGQAGARDGPVMGRPDGLPSPDPDAAPAWWSGKGPGRAWLGGGAGSAGGSSPAAGPVPARQAGADLDLERLREMIVAHAADLLSGPAGLAAWLRTGLLGGPVASASLPLDTGKPTETIPAHLRRAVIHRDRCCAFPGCTQRPAACQVHHIIHRSRGGPTALANLVLLCSFHHLTVIHRWGWAITLHPDGTTTATSPDGARTLRSHAPPGQGPPSGPPHASGRPRLFLPTGPAARRRGPEQTARPSPRQPVPSPG